MLGVTLLGCSSANSANSAKDAEPSSGSGGQPPTLNVPENGGNGGGEDDCQRQVTLEPVTLGGPMPFDLVIVADHSASLAWSRDALAAGLQDLLTNVRGRSVRVFLLTPTQYDASSASARVPVSGEPVVAWQDPTTGQGYAPAVTRYNQTCTDATGASVSCPDPKGKVPYVVQGTWEFVAPEPIAVLSPSLSDDEFATQQAAVATAILGLAGSGSPEEQPLCTLARYVTRDAASLPTNAAFLLITDEDDTSLPEDCLASYRASLVTKQMVSSTTACSTNCDAHRFSMDVLQRWPRFAYTCMAQTDTGEPVPGTEQSSYYNASTTCDGLVPGPCIASERATVEPFCGSGLHLVTCNRECHERSVPCQVILEDEVDACTKSFTYNGKKWANLTEFCESSNAHATASCKSEGLNLEYESSVQGSSSRTPLASGDTTEDLARYFRNQADSKFGSEHYRVQGIVLDPAFSCPLGPGQSYADNLAQMIDDRSHLFPLCEAYAPALRGVLDFAQTLIQTEFTLTLDSDEDVTAVTVVDANGTTRTLSADQYRFDGQTQVLNVESTAIRGTDRDLRVEVTSECRPVPR